MAVQVLATGAHLSTREGQSDAGCAGWQREREGPVLVEKRRRIRKNVKCLWLEGRPTGCFDRGLKSVWRASTISKGVRQRVRAAAGNPHQTCGSRRRAGSTQPYCVVEDEAAICTGGAVPTLKGQN